MKILFVAAMVLAVIALSSGEAQIAESECDRAAIYHLEAALRYENVESQIYHLNAATAAERLDARGGNHCGDWRESARPPTYDTTTGKMTDGAA